MPKQKKPISFLIPPYRHPRNEWRRAIHRRAVEAARAAGIPLKRFKKLGAVSVNVKLYLHRDIGRFHDVDNRLKDILDALQGRAGGKKGRKSGLRDKIIKNDSVVRRVEILKTVSPKSGMGDGGRVTVRPFKLSRKKKIRPAT
jgi:hypothetical protein